MENALATTADQIKDMKDKKALYLFSNCVRATRGKMRATRGKDPIGLRSFSSSQKFKDFDESGINLPRFFRNVF